MAFLLEDGTGLASSNSYASVAEFKAHHTDRGVFAASDYADALIEQGLINASDYIDKRFGRDFRGYRQDNDQAMEWPRVSAIDQDGFLLQGVPARLKKATAEYAWLWLKLERNLAPPPATDFSIINPNDQSTVETAVGGITSKTERVGPIEESTSYGSSSIDRLMVSTGSTLTQRLPEYPQADLWIEELLDYGNHELARG